MVDPKVVFPVRAAGDRSENMAKKGSNEQNNAIARAFGCGCSYCNSLKVCVLLLVCFRGYVSQYCMHFFYINEHLFNLIVSACNVRYGFSIFLSFLLLFFSLINFFPLFFIEQEKIGQFGPRTWEKIFLSPVFPQPVRLLLFLAIIGSSI